MSGVAVIIEDDDAIGALVGAYLERAGFEVVREESGEGGFEAVDRRSPRVVVLDLGLPDVDGFELCRRLRSSGDVPILIVTARDEEVDRIVGLELGADDYVTKPFSPRELVARVRAVLRRSEPDEEGDRVTAGDVVVERAGRTVSVAGNDVELTGIEFDLLAFLLAHPGIVMSRERLLERVWGLEFPGGTRTVDVHVAQLRRKLDRPDLIRTVRGSGYKAVT